jgi:hypothetical protein
MPGIIGDIGIPPYIIADPIGIIGPPMGIIGIPMGIMGIPIPPPAAKPAENPPPIWAET